MNVLENREMFPVPEQYANGIGERTEFEPADKAMHWNRLLAGYGLVAAVALTGAHNHITEEASALQRGNIATQPDGRLNTVIGTQAVRLNGEYHVEVDKAMIDNYDRTCQFAIDPWENLRFIYSLASKYPGNRIYRDMKRGGSALTHKDPYLKKHKGITLRVPKCGLPGQPASGSQLPEWEPNARVEVKDFDKEADTIRARTNCTGFPKPFWLYRTEKMNPDYFEDFNGIDIRIPWPSASIGLRIRFGETDPVWVPICSSQNRNKLKKLPTISLGNIGVRDIRSEVN